MIGLHGKVAAESLLRAACPLILQVSGHADIVPLPKHHFTALGHLLCASLYLFNSLIPQNNMSDSLDEDVFCLLQHFTSLTPLGSI